MKNLFALLTIGLLAVMPLQAAYGQSEPSCTSIETVLTPAEVTTVIENDGFVTRLDGVQKDAFLSRLVDLVGTSPPFTVSGIIAVRINDDEETSVNVGVASEGCLKAVFVLPFPIYETLLSPLDPPKPQGERVD